MLSVFVNSWWVKAGNVCLHWWWGEGRDKPTLSLGDNTFGLLAVQLVSVLTQAHGIPICDGCGELYARPGRKPQAGRRNFCSASACREKVASRLRKQTLRAKRKGKA